MTVRKLLILLMLLSAISCSTSMPYHIIGNTQESATLSACESLLHTVDQLSQHHQVKDPHYYSVPGFPYLRSNRFWSSFRIQDLTVEQQKRLISQLNRLDIISRKTELRNLLKIKNKISRTQIDMDEGILETVTECSEKMAALLPLSNEVLDVLQSKLEIPDDYQGWKKAAGFYPFSRLFLRAGVKRLNKKITKVFNEDLNKLPIKGKLTRIFPIDNLSAYSPESFTNDNLGIPIISEQYFNKLVKHHAPILEIDQIDQIDQIGKPEFVDDKIVINTENSVAYTYLSLMRFKNDVLPQVNYVFWFPRRRAKNHFDIYAGKVDGITWRVTLDKSGNPLVYDIIHNCGCYYMAFPTENLRLSPQFSANHLLSPQFAPTLHENKTRMVIRLSTGNHYVQRIYASSLEAPKHTYYFSDYGDLAEITDNNGTGLFNRHGIMRGTNRLEQFLLWPGGIRNAGAMRLRGRQPISFLRQLHFDDPNLFDLLFTYPQ